ncbi:hypothetical protein Q4555_09085 [Octadecabacter sp. 1_MG-2023]|uniref:hypothetical protein n=1 Tax=unclassified Octadecabacter TaxID=196158 RepID=UPI001C0A1080|nr:MULTISPECIES: hypothetical protein [unclassified Octadecabacter]MBU2992419.1 hypothetical protein [Octadecabacter sp. B2R22]MDO6734824.1 hypothetical protein [Octadecabacter sp. 1_MG-2023]
MQNLSRFDMRAVASLLVAAALFWAVSSQLYYWIVDALSLERGYDEAPFLFAAYYLAWACFAAFWFREPLFRKLDARQASYKAAIMLPMMMVLGVYVTVVLPMLPEVSVDLAPQNPPEFMFASAWYYLPKSADILFQQVLIAAMIFAMARQNIKLRYIALAMAVLFGGYHLTLGFDGFTTLYVARFTLSATVFGFFVPYLYLKARYGFQWAYGMHWSFYAVDATITHFVLGGAAVSA